MAVQLAIDLETLVDLVDQLKPEEQQILINHLHEKSGQQRLSDEEFQRHFKSLMADLGPIPSDYSFSREDWYGDDGR
jgi:hypothetical protein